MVNTSRFEERIVAGTFVEPQCCSLSVAMTGKAMIDPNYNALDSNWKGATAKCLMAYMFQKWNRLVSCVDEDGRRTNAKSSKLVALAGLKLKLHPNCCS